MKAKQLSKWEPINNNHGAVGGGIDDVADNPEQKKRKNNNVHVIYIEEIFLGKYYLAL